MLTQDIYELYQKFRLTHYRTLFGRIREKDGSLSATEAFAVDVIHLLGSPTVTQLAETLGISQPNATYKVNNLVQKGYVVKSSSEDDRRECRLLLGPKFYQYFGQSSQFIDQAAEKLQREFSSQELETFARVLRALTRDMT
ncbi:MAG: MarR family transcriptional regulator [Oscillospiraceae bacterium]|nr:MarR family transcriptional regulator [Oscillospiraceae bacterium]MBR6207928.1 MarR family transcriptional regulator [Oscillospiraceae bacterium]